jgi:hypothetical protein
MKLQMERKLSWKTSSSSTSVKLERMGVNDFIPPDMAQRTCTPYGRAILIDS